MQKVALEFNGKCGIGMFKLTRSFNINGPVLYA